MKSSLSYYDEKRSLVRYCSHQNLSLRSPKFPEYLANRPQVKQNFKKLLDHQINTRKQLPSLKKATQAISELNSIKPCVSVTSLPRKSFPEPTQHPLELIASNWKGQKLSNKEIALQLKLESSQKPRPTKIPEELITELSKSHLGAAILKDAVFNAPSELLHRKGLYNKINNALKQRQLRLSRYLKLSL